MRERHHTLPAVERVEYHRKAAKDLLRAVGAGEPAAVARLRDALGRVPTEPRLADAQRAIAREHGHGSWAAFRRDVESGADEPARAVARIGPGTPERYARGAEALLRGLAAGDEPARRRLRAHVARLAELDDAALAQRATAADARLVVAREYGFLTWPALVAGLREESEAWRRGREHPEPVACALAAIREGDVAALRRVLDASPELVHAAV